MVSEELIRALVADIAEEKLYLAAILEQLQGTTKKDVMVQYPDSIDKILLASGEVYERNPPINRTLKYLSIDVPDGVLLELFNNNELFFFATDEIGALEFPQGIDIGQLRIYVKNNSLITQKWSIRFIFK